MKLRLAVLPLSLLAACAQTSHSSSTHSSQPREVATQPAPQQELSGPRQYDLWRLQRWLDEDGNPPARDALHRARVEAKANADFWDMTDGGGIGRFGWTELGPDNIGGRTRSLVIHPTITSRMWAGSVGGGIWRSDNSGASWYPLDDWMGNLAIGCLTMDPNSTSVMYAGTGEGFGNFDAIRGEGIWKTTDGGTTWLQLASTVNFGSINRIVVSPVNSDLVIASTRWGIRRSTDGGTTWTTVRSGNSLQVIIDLIASTTTSTELKVYARLDEGTYPDKIKVTDVELATVQLHGDPFHAEWNYNITPRQQEQQTTPM